MAEPVTIDARPTAAEPDDDPHLWLEDINGQGALAWVEAQNRRTLARFDGDRFVADRDAITALLDHPANVPSIVRRGPHLYSLLIDAEHPRSLRSGFGRLNDRLNPTRMQPSGLSAWRCAEPWAAQWHRRECRLQRCQ